MWKIRVPRRVGLSTCIVRFAPRADRANRGTHSRNAIPDTHVMNHARTSMASTPPKALSRRWTFITNHGLVLLEGWQSPAITVRVIADAVGFTDRATRPLMS